MGTADLDLMKRTFSSTLTQTVQRNVTINVNLQITVLLLRSRKISPVMIAISIREDPIRTVVAKVTPYATSCRTVYLIDF